MKTSRRLAVACIVALGGCGSSPGDEVSWSEADLDGVVAAVHLSPQTEDFAEGDTDAYVVLIEGDGSYRSIPTDGMDVAAMTWTKEGLSFSDHKANYLIDGRHNVRIASDQADLQLSALVLPDDRRVAVLNEGIPATDRYQSEISVSDRTTSRNYLVDGFYETAAVCEDRVLGISTDASKYRRSSPGGDRWPFLAQLYPPTHGAERFIAFRPRSAEVEPTATSATAPCRQDVITFLSSDNDYDSAKMIPMVAQWNVSTGVFEQTRLLTDAGRPFAMDELAADSDLAFGAHLDGRSLNAEGTLDWVAGTGQVMRTEPETGRTRTVFDTRIASTSKTSTEVAFDDGVVHVLHVPEDLSSKVVFRTFDRETGRVLGDVGIADLGSSLGGDLIMRGMAVRPR